MSAPANHGKPWTQHDKDLCANLFCANWSVEDLCQHFGHTRIAIEAKLVDAGLLEYCGDGLVKTFLWATRNTAATTTQTPTKEQPIVNKLIETKTFILGIDVANGINDDAVFKAIYKAEQEVKALEAIEHKPRRLTARIAALKEEILALVAFLDAQEE